MIPPGQRQHPDAAPSCPGVPPPGRPRRTIAVGGASRGVGKTLLSVNLAVYLAQLGRSVIVCDADPQGSNLHAMLGLDAGPLALPEAITDGTAAPVETTVPGLRLMPTGYDAWTMAPKHVTRLAQWLAPLDRLEVDYAVLNLGASISGPSLDAFCEADVGICVAAPEPLAIEATYRFCRALFARRLRRTLMRERFKLRVVERALAALPPLPTPLALVAEIGRFDEAVAATAALALRQLNPGLVIGKTRLRRDLELGPAMCSLSERYLGVTLSYLGHVEHDDAVWVTARRRRPLLIDAPTSKGARDLERVARRALAALGQPQSRLRPADPSPPSRLRAPLTLYDVLLVSRTASDDEIRRAYKRQREIFREDSLPIVSLVDAAGIRREQARVEEAYDTLLDPIRKQAYDLSIFPEHEHLRPDAAQARTSLGEAELAMLQAELAREITPDTQFSGALLRKAREALGLEVGELAQATKIAPAYLRALEAEQFAALPAEVYVRGFLQLVAKALRLDPTQVVRTYMKRLRVFIAEGDE